MRKGSCLVTNLRTQRVAAGMSLNELARRAVFNTTYLARLENGANCEQHEAQRLADALGISLATLGKTDIG
jgi:transcriptional regulator with XRE-family HTH domain